ncbi:phosphate acetyltransferase [Spiroplasma endosymbiont of Othius punctulatus]|uniref:phosphate acetyltransferase n=1 Tax=Spiroplasma endosymbiont of Othius punctulatus TaxID=3066289 RepID=UPI0030D3184B
MYSVKEIENILIKTDVKQTIVFAEGWEEKIQKVANHLTNNKIANVVMLFNKSSEIPKGLNESIKICSLDQIDKTPYINKFIELRKEKTNIDDATKLMNKTNYISVMMVKMSEADCVLSGLTYTTADTIRPALQVIKTKPGLSLAASVFIINKGEENYLFTDCALNIKPTSQQLADIAKMTAKFGEAFKFSDVEVAMLSYSTAGSGSGEDVDRVRGAVEILNSQNNNFNIVGEIQFDAAWDKEVRDKKMPRNKMKKNRPDVYVFPDINSANIGYKIAQRMGGYNAIGPFIMGFNNPVNDLSRGATLEDVQNTAIITIFQAMEKK